MRMNTGNFALFCSLLGFYLSCSKPAVLDDILGADDSLKDFKTYLIKRGEHHSTRGFQRIRRNLLEFDVLFDSSCIYYTRLPENAGDINKLYGFSDCGSQHHVNSARIGWLWNGDSIQLYAYSYVNKKRLSEKLGSVPLNKIIHLSIEATATEYHFRYNDELLKVPRHCTESVVKGYRLYPYFGGDETAPHDITIRIREN